MRIGLTISMLSRGGAERQLIALAKGLAKNGHSVFVYCYGGESDLDVDLARSIESVQTGARGGWITRVRQFSSWIDEVRPDIVHGFMKRASTLAVLARRRRHRCAVVASDFSTATFRPNSLELRVALLAFRHADAVVTETEENRRNLERLAPALHARLRVVRNGLDIERFLPGEVRSESNEVRFGAVGTVCQVKNPVTLVRAVALVRDVCDEPFSVEWVGRLGYAGDHEPSGEYIEAARLIGELNLEQHFQFLGEQTNIESHYREWNALIHPSHQEGFPNAVAEAMACGLPILVGRVSDLPLAVSSAENGIVFDQNSAESIASAMRAFMELPFDDRLGMSRRSVRLSRDWFALDRFVRDHEALYEELMVTRA